MGNGVTCQASTLGTPDEASQANSAYANAHRACNWSLSWGCLHFARYTRRLFLISTLQPESGCL
eukprot:2026098-Amphidinium_carterae.1